MKTTRNILSLFTVLSLLFFAGCNQPNKKETPTKAGKKKLVIQRKAPDTVGYHFVKPKKWFKQLDVAGVDEKQMHIVLAVNRIDSASFQLLDSALIPNSLAGDIEYYLPFPFTVPALEDIDKIIFFSYPTQSFGAYENGQLVYAGPTNMGRKKDPTPTGLFYTNWKAEQTTSTFNDEWDLKWNFNIESELGVGWHQYAMPGYPASHSCLRLQEWDAKYLYKWADQFILDKSEKIVVKGTPVIVFGNYDFDGKKPWLQLATNPTALAIKPEELQSLATPHLAEIREWQTKRNQQ